MPAKPRALRAVAAGVLLCAAASQASATTEDEAELALAYGDKAFISLATGAKQTLRRAPAVATVITAQDIAAMGATDLDEVLETVPGIHVARAAITYQPIYVVRGIFSTPTNPQVLMLQNGVPMTTLYTGDKGNVWGGLALHHIARIEIIRGPGSALYGADAYAGVINLITKTAAEVDGTELGSRVGAFNGKEAWVQHGGKLGAVDVAAYLHWGKTDGQKELLAQDAQTTRDTATGTQASRAPGPVNTAVNTLDANVDLALDQWRLRMGYKGRDHVGLYVGAASALDPDSYIKSERTNADLSWTAPQWAPDVGVGVLASYLNYSERTDDTNLMLSPPGTQIGPSVFPGGFIGGPNRWERSLRLSGFVTYSGFKGHALRAGAGHDDLDLYKTLTYKNYIQAASGLPVPNASPLAVESSATQPHITPVVRQNNYLYAQDEWNFAPDWTLTAGARRDLYSDFGGTTNPRLALVWDTSLDLTTKLLWGSAFRAPAFVEAYGINPAQTGNPTILPERMENVELVANWQARKDTQVNLSLFSYELYDMIRVVANATPGTGGTWRNVGRQRGAGGELEAVWDASPAVRLTGNVAWQHATDLATNTDSGFAPHQHAFVRADWRFTPGWQMGAQVNSVMDRVRASGDTRAALPDYTSTDLTLRTSVNRQWEIAGSVRNVFNATILEPSAASTVPSDLPQAGRSWYVQATYKL